MMRSILRSAWQAILAAMFGFKTAFAVTSMLGYPFMMLAGIVIFIAAFQGNLLLGLFWLGVFAVLTVFLVIAAFIKSKGASFGAALFAICCQLGMLVIVCNMASTTSKQVWVNFWTIVVCWGALSAQFSLWWLLRHRSEVWLRAKTWFAKLFPRRTPAATPITPVAATLGTPPSATPHPPTAGSLGGGTGTPPP